MNTDDGESSSIDRSKTMTSLILIIFMNLFQLRLANQPKSFSSLRDEQVIPFVRSGGTAVIPVSRAADCQYLKLKDSDVIPADKSVDCESKALPLCSRSDSTLPCDCRLFVMCVDHYAPLKENKDQEMILRPVLDQPHHQRDHFTTQPRYDYTTTRPVSIDHTPLNNDFYLPVDLGKLKKVKNLEFPDLSKESESESEPESESDSNESKDSKEKLRKLLKERLKEKLKDKSEKESSESDSESKSASKESKSKSIEAMKFQVVFTTTQKPYSDETSDHASDESETMEESEDESVTESDNSYAVNELSNEIDSNVRGNVSRVPDTKRIMNSLNRKRQGGGEAIMTKSGQDPQAERVTLPKLKNLAPNTIQLIKDPDQLKPSAFIYQQIQHSNLSHEKAVACWGQGYDQSLELTDAIDLKEALVLKKKAVFRVSHRLDCKSRMCRDMTSCRCQACSICHRDQCQCHFKVTQCRDHGQEKKRKVRNKFYEVIEEEHTVPTTTVRPTESVFEYTVNHPDWVGLTDDLGNGTIKQEFKTSSHLLREMRDYSQIVLDRFEYLFKTLDRFGLTNTKGQKRLTTCFRNFQKWTSRVQKRSQIRSKNRAKAKDSSYLIDTLNLDPKKRILVKLKPKQTCDETLCPDIGQHCSRFGGICAMSSQGCCNCDILILCKTTNDSVTISVKN